MTSCRVLYMSDFPARTEMCGKLYFKVSEIRKVAQAVSYCDSVSVAECLL